MTDREKAIVMAYTGICMLIEDKFQIFHKYVEDIMGRPVYTHELAYRDVQDEIKEKAKADFIALCAEQESCEDCVSRQSLLNRLDPLYKEKIKTAPDNMAEGFLQVSNLIKYEPPVTPTRKEGKWIEVWESQRDKFTGECDEWREHRCSVCGFQELDADRFNYCPNCGAEMEK
jgi:rubrerythrin